MDLEHSSERCDSFLILSTAVCASVLLPLDPKLFLLQVRLDFYHKLLISRIINGGNGTGADR